MTIAAILKHKGSEVFTVAPTVTITDLVAALAEKKVGAVPVVDGAGQILGIVSERDVVRSLAHNGGRTLDMTAGQLMTRAMFTVRREASVVEAMEMMTRHRIRHLPVVENDHMVGIISIGDVVKARIMQQEQEVDSLRAYVAGAA